MKRISLLAAVLFLVATTASGAEINCDQTSYLPLEGDCRDRAEVDDLVGCYNCVSLGINDALAHNICVADVTTWATEQTVMCAEDYDPPEPEPRHPIASVGRNDNPADPTNPTGGNRWPNGNPQTLTSYRYETVIVRQTHDAPSPYKTITFAQIDPGDVVGNSDADNFAWAALNGPVANETWKLTLGIKVDSSTADPCVNEDACVDLLIEAAHMAFEHSKDTVGTFFTQNFEASGAPSTCFGGVDTEDDYGDAFAALIYVKCD